MNSKSRSSVRAATTVAMPLIGLAAANAQAAPATQDLWQFELTPYLFGAGLDGRTGVGGVTADVGLSFGDMLDNLDAGFMAMFETRKGAWGFGVNGVYFQLKDEKTRT